MLLFLTLMSPRVFYVLFFFLINAAGWIILSLKSEYTDKDLPAYTYKGSYLSC